MQTTDFVFKDSFSLDLCVRISRNEHPLFTWFVHKQV